MHKKIQIASMFNFLVFLSLLYSFSFAQKPLTINTPLGSVEGFTVDHGNNTQNIWYGRADVFIGIPFAQPPVGELRFKQPRPITKFPGPSPYNASYFRLPCIQPGKLDTMSEDCLYLNILTPNATATDKYPVMLFIHGGGLITGDSHFDWIHQTRCITAKGVVFVGIEYRMSWLGFFTTFTDDFPPNLGMLDQVQALRFVKSIIPYFGGDPNRITVAGQSAGAHSASSHTYSPLSQNLFQQVILESGTVLTCYEDSLGPTNVSMVYAEWACGYTQEMWNSGNFTKLKECLMNISVEDGMKSEGRATGHTSNHVCWNMVQDNYFFPSTPQNLWKTRPNKPAIIGTCRDEYELFEFARLSSDKNLTTYTKQLVEQRLLQMYAEYFGDKSQQVLQLFEDNYLPKGTADDDHFQWLMFDIKVGTAAYFTWGAVQEIQYFLANNNPSVYTYEFDWADNINDSPNPLASWGYNAARHGCEMSFLFDYGAWGSSDQYVANLMQDSWTNFVIHGKPSLNDSWKPTTSKIPTALEYLSINNESSMQTGYRAVDYTVWIQELPKILGDSPPNLPHNYPICPRGVTSKVKNTTCYEAFGTSLAWDAAENACGTTSYGNLVTIGSAFENSDLLNYAKKAYPSCSSFYIGLYKNSFTNNWNWANYDTSAFKNWKSGYPTSDANANCVVLNANDGTWTNQACTNAACYVCSYW